MKAIRAVRCICCVLISGHAVSIGAETIGDAELGRAKSAICVSCHGEDGLSAGPNVPHLKGQRAEYLVNALKAYKNRGRRDPVAVMMYPFADHLSEQDMSDLAAFYASLSGDSTQAKP